jgi:dTDP-4-dehydrorhamnose 3,5-epimerase
MGQFIFTKTGIEGVFVIEPKVFGDERGYFMETYNKADFENAGIKCEFVQDNQSRSKQGVLRGLHFQKVHPQAKLVRVTEGEVFDVAVDLRKDSPTWGKYVGTLLSAEKRNQFFVPRGFAHGFLVLSPFAEFCYKCDDFYRPEEEGGIPWDDPSLGIEWPEVACGICLSEKDTGNRSLAGERVFL